MPCCPARMMAGSASAMAAAAAVRSPDDIASSTLRTALRTRVRRDLLITGRRAVWRVAFLADLVLAITFKRDLVYRTRSIENDWLCREWAQARRMTPWAAL